jgi:hypothetical protein
MEERNDFKCGYWSRVEIPTRMQIFFSLIFVYKLYSTNSYKYTNYSTNSYKYTNCIVQIHTIRTFFIQIVSLYRPKPWTEFCPRFASKMGTYVSRNVSLTTEFACTYLRRQYQNHVRSPKWREIQTTPETGLHGM